MKQETWNIKGKPTKVLVVRTNGKLQSWIPIKGLKERGVKYIASDGVERTARTRRTLQSVYKQKGSFSSKVLSRDVFSKGVVRTITKRRAQPQEQTQVAVELTIRKRKGTKGRTFTGYSNKGKSDFDGIRQARGRAFKVAIESGYITYTDVQDMSIMVDERVFYIGWK